MTESTNRKDVRLRRPSLVRAAWRVLRNESKVDRFRRLGAKIGVNVRLNGDIDTVNPNLVEIGENTVVGKNTQIITHCPVNPGPVKIGRDVFIGYSCIILPGVVVGDGSLIGAGSVVTKDIPPMSVAVGNPANVIGSRNPYEMEHTIALVASELPVGKIGTNCRFKATCRYYDIDGVQCNEEGDEPLPCPEYQKVKTLRQKSELIVDDIPSSLQETTARSD